MGSIPRACEDPGFFGFMGIPWDNMENMGFFYGIYGVSLG
jgi:hypothetical protein